MVLNDWFLFRFQWNFFARWRLFLRGLRYFAFRQFDSISLSKRAYLLDIATLRDDRALSRQHGGVVLLLPPPLLLPPRRFVLEDPDARPAALTLLRHHVAAHAADVRLQGGAG